MINYKDDPDYRAANKRSQWLIVEAAKITHELNQSELQFLRTGHLTSRTHRAELIDRRSAYQLEIKELEVVLYDAREASRTSQRQDKYDTLVSLLNEHNLGHYVKQASEIRNTTRHTKETS